MPGLGELETCQTFYGGMHVDQPQQGGVRMVQCGTNEIGLDGRVIVPSHTVSLAVPSDADRERMMEMIKAAANSG